MFSISFGEILLIATVGLVVIGPKRLPHAARFAGHLIGRVQRQIQGVKADIKREMDAADVQGIREEYQQAASKTGESAGDIFKTIRQTAADATGGISQSANDNKPADDKTADNKTADNNNIPAQDKGNFPPPHTAPGATNKAD
ncbi:MAG: Sec-independent protein translocase protein TatB [Gammaproteobacteria bacterium]